jgi:hypothetical protein
MKMCGELGTLASAVDLCLELSIVVRCSIWFTQEHYVSLTNMRASISESDLEILITCSYFDVQLKLKLSNCSTLL